MEFSNGDKVRTVSGRTGTIVYGPFDSDRYLIKGATHFTASAERLSRAVAFAVEDKVKDVYSGVEFTIVGGPFFGDSEWYAVRDDAGKVVYSGAADLRPLVAAASPISVGDHVRVIKARYAERLVGKIAVVKSTTDGWTPSGDVAHPYIVKIDGSGETINAAEVERLDTFEHDDITYLMGVKYVDKDGDAWVFRTATLGSPRSTDGSVSHNERLSYVVSSFGPLTRQDGADKPVTVDGRNYVMGVDYEDADGDLWRFAVNYDGVPASVAGSYQVGRTLRDVVTAHSPLTRR